MDDRNIEWIDMIDDADPQRIGGKGVGLSLLANAGFRVPPGFVVDADVFDEMIDRAHIDLGDLLTRHPVEYSELRLASSRCRSAVRASAFSPDLVDRVRAALITLTSRSDVVGDPSFVVRSSATDEDTTGHSFAGIHESFTDLSSPEEVLTAIVACWQSAFGQRALAYRSMRHVVGVPRMAVIVQSMVDSERAGVMFSTDPRDAADDAVVVEAVFGHGETLVGGEVEPDSYVVDRPMGGRASAVRSVHIGSKAVAVTRDASGAATRNLVPEASAARRVLDDAEVLALAQLALSIERAIGAPQDIEWAMDRRGRTWIVQSRPLTTSGKGPVPIETEPRAGVLSGLGAAPGSATGPVRVVRSAGEADAIRSGEILVAPMTTPDWISAIRRSSAVVTDGGGVTSHAAIIGRELGIPAVVATHDATARLHDGDVVTVDGGRGTVTLGRIEEHAPQVPIAREPESQTLRTGVYVNVATVERARRAAELPGVDGIGLLRAEFLLTDALDGEHPGALIEGGRSDEFVSRMATSISEIAAAFEPRPVVYRSADFRTNEFRSLRGGERYEPVEANPMIGYRGCFRYVHEPAQFRLELAALARVSRERRNLVLMLPFVRTKWEVEACLALIAESDLHAAGRVPLWVMAEVPSILYRLTDYRALGIDGVSIGTNDLTQLMLGVDRDSELCAELFDERDDAVIAAVLDIIDRSHRVGLTVSLCGQAPSNHPEIVRGLVAAGIDSVSVDPDAVVAVRSELGHAEQTLGRPLLPVAVTSPA